MGWGRVSGGVGADSSIGAIFQRWSNAYALRRFVAVHRLMRLHLSSIERPPVGSKCPAVAYPKCANRAAQIFPHKSDRYPRSVVNRVQTARPPCPVSRWSVKPIRIDFTPLCPNPTAPFDLPSRRRPKSFYVSTTPNGALSGCCPHLPA